MYRKTLESKIIGMIIIGRKAYSQTIPMFEKILSKKVKATLADGVLDIVLPKSKPIPKPKKKPVKVQ